MCSVLTSYNSIVGNLHEEGNLVVTITSNTTPYTKQHSPPLIKQRQIVAIMHVHLFIFKLILLMSSMATS